MEKSLLAKKTIVLTHPVSEGSEDFCQLFQNQGAKVHHFPMINIEGLPVSKSLISGLGSFSTIIFTSKNGVKHFFSESSVLELVRKYKPRIVSIGSKTSEALYELSIKVDVEPKAFNSDELLTQLKSALTNEHILLVLGNLAPDKIEQQLSELNTVQRINVYRTSKTHKVDSNFEAILAQETIDFAIFTSPSCFEGFLEVYPQWLPHLNKLVSIGKATTKCMQKYGYNPWLTSEESTYNGIYKSIVKNI